MNTYDPKYDSFIDWVKSEMEILGLTHKDVAKHGCSRSLVTRTLGKKNNPGQQFFIAVAGALKVSLDEIYMRANISTDIRADLESAEPIVRKMADLSEIERANVEGYVDYIRWKKSQEENSGTQDDTQEQIKRADNLDESARRRIVDAGDGLNQTRKKKSNPSSNRPRPVRAMS